MSQPPLNDPGNVPTIWATELTSIEVFATVTILTFAEVVHAGGPDPVRRVCARIAIESKLLPKIGERIAALKTRAKAISAPPAGSA